VDFERLSEEQRRVFRAIAGPREGNVGGPYTVWIHEPAIAEVMNNVGDVLRVNGKLDKRLMELMVLTLSRHWRCDYQWTVHENAARKAGLSDAVMAAIREGRTPSFEKRDEAIVYAAIRELIDTTRLSEETYRTALDLLGMGLLVELITNAGRYTQAAMVINAFDITKPGAPPVFERA
jgi:4-carboxymuconolactone decarboxylase